MSLEMIGAYTLVSVLIASVLHLVMFFVYVGVNLLAYWGGPDLLGANFRWDWSLPIRAYLVAWFGTVVVWRVMCFQAPAFASVESIWLPLYSLVIGLVMAKLMPLMDD